MRPACVAVAVALLVGAVSLVGCGREEQAEIDLQVEQRIAASRAGLTLERAREIVAEVSDVPVDEVTVMHRSVDAGVATVLAAVPVPGEMQGEDPIESIDLRWDLEHDLPTMILWGERPRVVPREQVPPEEAERTALQLMERWLPEASPAIEREALRAQKLRAPIYVVEWLGTIDGHLTGDQAVVQVSSANGLAISFNQQIAQQRPSPDEIKVTRDEALEIVREHLRGEGVAGAERVDLVGQLTLSAPAHPQGGPAWLVAMIDVAGRQRRLLIVDAMTGEVLARERAANEGATEGEDG
ncbi:MAG: PepSY domain-containing protein [Armatimonadota bacterium]